MAVDIGYPRSDAFLMLADGTAQLEVLLFMALIPDGWIVGVCQA